MDKFARVLVASILVAGLTACDGVYTSTQSGDGSVVVVNKYSGTVRRVQGDYISDVGPRPKQEPTAKHGDPMLALATIPQQPVHIFGLSEYRDGKMLVQVTVMPYDTLQNEAEWKTWRDHMDRARYVAGLSLQFFDARGFYPIETTLELSSMRRIVNAQGEFQSLETQVSIPTSEETYHSLTGWEVGWHAWPAYTGGELRKR